MRTTFPRLFCNEMTAIWALALCAISAQGGVLFTYPDFTSTSGLTFVGNTGTTVTGDGTVLRLTPAATNQRGAAYSTVAVPLGNNATFSTQFQFRLNSPGGINPADGFVFVVGTSTSGLGGAGGGLGYAGAAGNSVAIEFDTFNNGAGDANSSNHVAIDTNGSLTSANLTNVYGIATCNFTGNSYQANGCLSNGHLWTANVSYNGTNLTVTLNDPLAGSTFTAINNLGIDIASTLGQNTAFVGFTASTGSGFENHDILNWTFSNSARIDTTPEPGVALLVGVGLLATIWLARRSRWKQASLWQ